MFGCRKKMSAIAILDYSGAEAIYHHMEALAQQGRTAWLAHNAGGGSASAAQADTAAAGPFALSHSGSASHLLGSDPAAQQKVCPCTQAEYYFSNSRVLLPLLVCQVVPAFKDRIPRKLQCLNKGQSRHEGLPRAQPKVALHHLRP